MNAQMIPLNFDEATPVVSIIVRCMPVAGVPTSVTETKSGPPLAGGSHAPAARRAFLTDSASTYYLQANPSRWGINE